MRVADAVQTELLPHEVVLWSGVPGQGIRLRKSDALMIPFSMLWGGFALFWEGMVLHTNGPLLFKLWGIPFVLVGLYITIGRFFVDERKRARTVYAVTDQRVLIITRLFGRQVVTLLRSRLPEINVSEHGDGSGTLTFGPETTGRRQRTSPAFEFIADPKTVLALVMPQSSAGYR
jgi:hypothetical protein